MAEPTKIYIWNHDAIEVRGEFDLVDAEGGVYGQHNRVRLCRCGGSAKKPYCDNSHIRTGFQSEISAKSD